MSFDKFTWISICLMLICLTLLFKIINIKYNTPQLSSLWILTTILLKQPYSTKNIKVYYLKFILSTWLIACFILANIYGGCIYSSITLPSTIRIETINDLSKAARENQLTIILYDDSALNTYFYICI